MKKLLILSIVSIVLFDCKKEDHFIQKVDNHEICDPPSVIYYFTGTIKDTSNGNPVVGYTIHPFVSLSNFIQPVIQILDSTYAIGLSGDALDIPELNKFVILNTTNDTVDSFSFPASIWIANDTARYNHDF